MMTPETLAKNITSQTTTVVRKGAGYLHRITVNKGAATGTAAIYDGVDTNGTLIGTITFGDALPRTLDYMCRVSVGICIVTATADANITVIYS